MKNFWFGFLTCVGICAFIMFVSNTAYPYFQVRFVNFREAQIIDTVRELEKPYVVVIGTDTTGKHLLGFSNTDNLMRLTCRWWQDREKAEEQIKKIEEAMWGPKENWKFVD